MTLNRKRDLYQRAVEKMSEAKRPVQRALDALFAKNGVVKVLEAGCGSTSHLRFGENARITGVDISEKALANNELLAESILGDLQTYRLPRGEYDVVVCWNVLEHLATPGKAVVNLAEALKPHGLLVLAMPNVMSFEGLLTRVTPHWLHVLLYDYIFGHKRSGEEDGPPYRTYMRMSISPPLLKRLVAQNGLTIDYSCAYANEPRMAVLKMTSRTLYFGYKALAWACYLLSAGRISRTDGAYLMMLRKQPSSRPT
jgi:ubiquinone/menaquinone biosynthesis C-methylase UbiE